jgi:hypothetical protein
MTASERQQGVLLSALRKLLLTQAAHARGETDEDPVARAAVSCMVAGYLGSLQADATTKRLSCKPTQPQDVKDFQTCGTSQFPCNPVIFGKGDDGKVSCISRTQVSYVLEKRWTRACEIKMQERAKIPEPRRKLELEDADMALLGKYLEEQKIDLKAASSLIDQLCQAADAMKSKSDIADCKLLKSNMAFEWVDQTVRSPAATPSTDGSTCATCPENPGPQATTQSMPPSTTQNLTSILGALDPLARGSDEVDCDTEDGVVPRIHPVSKKRCYLNAAHERAFQDLRSLLDGALKKEPQNGYHHSEEKKIGKCDIQLHFARNEERCVIREAPAMKACAQIRLMKQSPSDPTKALYSTFDSTRDLDLLREAQTDPVEKMIRVGKSKISTLKHDWSLPQPSQDSGVAFQRMLIEAAHDVLKNCRSDP